MAVIPGKYVDRGGRELTVIAGARHGLTGEGAVVYRDGGGGVLVLSEREWEEQGYVYAAELELEGYLAGESRAELAKRLFDVFATRNGVYCLRWRTVTGAEGVNYACENQGRAPGCRRGVDSCKNCRFLKPEPFSEAAAAKHLSGEITAGIYPVFPDGTCRFLVFEPGGLAVTGALWSVCRENDIPAYCELIGKRSRLWIFFSEGIPLPRLRRLGFALVTLTMERCPEAGFELYDSFIPCRGEISPGDVGFRLMLPFGRYGRDTGVFTDEAFRPLSHGPAELFRVRTVTGGYLADRLRALNVSAADIFWSSASRPRPLPEGTELNVGFDGDLVVSKEGLSHGAALALRRMACVKNPEPPYGEFEAPRPCVSKNFTEDGDSIRLPRGLRRELEYMAGASGLKPAGDGLPEYEDVYFSLSRPAGEAQAEAAEALAREREGILLAPLGWGKTDAAVKLISMKRRRTLIITPDEVTRERWSRNVMERLGIDTERSGGKIHVRTADDRHVRGKYGLVLLADCSRMPVDEEIFARIRALRPEFIYGITAYNHRRDGKWGFIHMLCGPVVYEA